MLKFWSAKRKRKRERRERARVFGTRPLMEYIQERIAQNQVQLPELHQKALQLGLCPQPWWDVNFYKWAIKQKEIEG